MATVAPSATAILSTPADGDGTIVGRLVGLQLEEGLAGLDGAPSGLSQRARMPSEIDSPTPGTWIETVAIGVAPAMLAGVRGGLRIDGGIVSRQPPDRGDDRAKRFRGRGDQAGWGDRGLRADGPTANLGGVGADQVGQGRAEGRLDQLLLLAVVDRLRAGRRAGAGVAADVLELVSPKSARGAGGRRTSSRPCSAILPGPRPTPLAFDDTGRGSDFRASARPGIELLEADDGDLVGVADDFSRVAIRS